VQRGSVRFALTSQVVRQYRKAGPATTIRKAPRPRQVPSREFAKASCYTRSVPERTRQPNLFCVATAVLLGALLAGMHASSQDAVSPPSSSPDSPSPVELVRTAVANEVAAANDDSTKHMFRSRKQTPQGSQTRLYVETREAMAGITIANNDQPLTPEQMADEENRLAGFVGNPEQLRHKHSQEQESAERTLRIVKALPDAFLYDQDGEERGSADLGKDGDRLVRLKFRPNPAYHPPSHVEEVLTGMQGVVLIDSEARRIARIDGTLFKEVGFGWGILGHLDKGGHFLVEQRDVGDGSWDISRMSLGFTGKILLFKSLSIKSNEAFSDFRRVPSGTTFAQGVEMLKAEAAKLAETHKREQGRRPRSQEIQESIAAISDYATSRRGGLRASSAQRFLPHGQPFDEIFFNAIARSSLVADGNRSLG
jgi:hypothetical protein